ncbi:PREDICTED: WD repeat-containing protein 25 isoform X2 [Nelumbo nucifera]|uniref:WD repeat-containing protein 25 isoform X2 n=1 Tax=Nelumbo nucifera TaxID=4432 RepID=A0A1U8QCS6_NELNU|nr:PREDICTED: WD repeat-containing protein 25 isoform X2 [Nelumbo nucifera]
MDLLFNAYSAASDEEDDDEKKLVRPPLKRIRRENPTLQLQSLPEYCPNNYSNQRQEASIPGRYISKRERAISAVASRVSEPDPSSMVITSPVIGSISESDVPFGILSSLRCKGKGHAQHGQTPERLSKVLTCHTKPVNSIQWSPTHDHLLASAGMDHMVCIWNVWSKSQQKARIFNYHNAAVKDVRWLPQGFSLLSCGYDCSSRLVDIEKGIETQIFKEDQVVGVIKFHPENSNLFLSGGSKGHLKLWDIRVGKAMCNYNRNLGPVLDVDFSYDAKHFISSSDISRSNVSENSIIVWDVSRQVPLSNQVCCWWSLLEWSFIGLHQGLKYRYTQYA